MKPSTSTSLPSQTVIAKNREVWMAAMLSILIIRHLVANTTRWSRIRVDQVYTMASCWSSRKNRSMRTFKILRLRNSIRQYLIKLINNRLLLRLLLRILSQVRLRFCQIIKMNYIFHLLKSWISNKRTKRPKLNYMMANVLISLQHSVTLLAWKMIR